MEASAHQPPQSGYLCQRSRPTAIGSRTLQLCGYPQVALQLLLLSFEGGCFFFALFPLPLDLILQLAPSGPLLEHRRICSTPLSNVRAGGCHNLVDLTI
jgi:hypothetical protein